MKIAAIQMISGADLEHNIATARCLLIEAAEDGAQLLLLPEYWPLMGLRDTDKLDIAEPAGTGPMQSFLAEMARTLKVWLIGGTIPMQSPEPGKVLNTTLVWNPEGTVCARYDKMHLFGFTKGEESYEESRTITPGHQVAAFDLELGQVGLSICYDLRFPELYRAMRPCALIVVPAAFTYTTGQAHWEILLRARAIENQCYVLASGQGGVHQNGRRTWGHSMLIDPWGKVLAVLPEGEGFVSGELDTEVIRNIRQSLPALKHRQIW
ncbi:carbon-nitrogen hydrolase family protein [Undibacterium oligocarboniphilum]|uniref:Carbon-nitrogen hydrolase family protein n=1 Tax=Undibacterium oligocarboniphilum TaxID=666702 RepID=A0A850QKE4_9BURK|nr:carbon-nitrogen hydrolase family protein [Undibacterium oligocarboniphilum]MBC3869220.1 carbon-nitrogen hydrolase family protein [Undibacterium oligocarboniphilum]NVO77200.1 carbon-nitrogen hydrolase family protein [Undibacterium oligocarboniphilum]